MRRLSQLALLACLVASCAPAEPPGPKLTYPTPRKGDVVEDYHGTKVADPYRWMEDLDAKETADWVAASNAVTEPYLAQLPLRQRFNQRLTELWNYPRVSIPSVENGQLFYTRNTGLQRQAPVFMRAGPGRAADAGHRSQRDLRGRLRVARAVRAIAGRQAPRLRPRRRRRRLAHDPGARHRHGQGPAGRCEVDALLRHLVDQGLQGLLLLPLSRAAQEQGARGRALRARGLLPRGRHAAVRGPLDLRAQGSARVDRRRQRDRRRPLSAGPDVRGRGQPEPALRSRISATR